MNRAIMIQAIQAGLSKAVERVDAGLCPTCDEEVGPFRDDLSRKVVLTVIINKYGISGMCQTCQDKTFGWEDY